MSGLESALWILESASLVESLFTGIIIPSIDKGIHALKRDNSGIFCVILNRCTSSTPLSSALKLPEFSPLEVAESVRRKFFALQGA